MIKNGWLYVGDDEKYRFALGEPGKNNLVIIGLNPSTATPTDLDPTIRRIRKIVELFKCDGWIMINLCAIRTPRPDDLPKVLDNMVSKKNIDTIAKLQKDNSFEAVYAAWGANIEKRDYMIEECQKIADIIETDAWFTRGLTKKGHPRHPLYLPYAQEPQHFACRDYISSFKKC